MKIPKFRHNGELTPGEYKTTIDAINQRFGSSNNQRKALMKGLYAAVDNLIKANVKRIWINGSFITNKTDPNDIDGCWEFSSEVIIKKLDPVFLQTSRIPMKAKYGIDFFPTGIFETSSGLPFPKFFQLNRDGDPKGILFVNIGGLL